MESENRKVEGAYQWWQSLMAVKLKTCISAYFVYELSRARVAMEKGPRNIERRFPLYDFTRYLTHMRNYHVPSKSISDNIYKSQILKLTNIEQNENMRNQQFPIDIKFRPPQ
jgi:hypothetical protein